VYYCVSNWVVVVIVEMLTCNLLACKFKWQATIPLIKQNTIYGVTMIHDVTCLTYVIGPIIYKSFLPLIRSSENFKDLRKYLKNTTIIKYTRNIKLIIIKSTTKTNKIKNMYDVLRTCISQVYCVKSNGTISAASSKMQLDTSTKSDARSQNTMLML
jgi:hypothetical protein